jgi:hypothetical protein
MVNFDHENDNDNENETAREGIHAANGNSAGPAWLAFVNHARRVLREKIGMSLSRFRGV